MGLNTRAAELWLDGEATELTRKPIELSLVGDPNGHAVLPPTHPAAMPRTYAFSSSATRVPQRACTASGRVGTSASRRGSTPAVTVLSRLDVRPIKKYTSALS